MINAVLYSDQIIPANSAIDLLLLEMIGGPGSRIGYIPSGPDRNRHFFAERRAYYQQYGLDLAVFYDLDEDDNPARLDDLLACDAIHLSGGHTAGFLARLRRRNMLQTLRRWGEDGGILIGASAGAILLTPTIAVDALFSGGRPEDVADGAALGLVPFEFFPHLNAKPTYLPDLLRYSARIPRTIIACADGDGVVVTGGKVRCIGNPLWLANGKASQVREIAFADIPS